MDGAIKPILRQGYMKRLGELADFMQSAKNVANKAEVPTIGSGDNWWNRHIAGVKAGDVLFGEAPEYLNDISYGFSPFTGGNAATGGLGTLTLDKRALDVPGAIGTAGLVKSAAMPAMAGVIKKKGGNWLAGSVEDSVRGLKKKPAWSRNLPDEPPVSQSHVDEIQEIVDDPTTTDHLRASATTELNELKGQNALNSWIDKQLVKYIKNDMATPEDPVRKLAEQDILHYEPGAFLDESFAMDQVHGRRVTAGQPEKGYGENDLSRMWERHSDYAIRNLEARDLSHSELEATFGTTAKRDPASIVHDTGSDPIRGIRELGFNHLTDELYNAIRPDSDLPRNLQIAPDKLGKMNMEAAVRHVAKINEWRAKSAAEANAKLANNPATHEYRTYENIPGTTQPNKRGLKWVELKPGDNVGTAYLGGGKYEDPKMNALQDALKYEGDTMGHCVGGYCDDVASGKSRIFSLRDSKGQPHVTIEVGKGYDDPVFNIPEDAQDKINEATTQYMERHYPHLDDESDEYMDIATRKTQELADEWAAANPRRSEAIKQIKGKGNAKPKDEYLPFVQDFVKHQGWSDVGDIYNTGLSRLPEHVEEYMSSSGINLGPYVTDAEYDYAVSLFNAAGLKK